MGLNRELKEAFQMMVGDIDSTFLLEELEDINEVVDEVVPVAEVDKELGAILDDRMNTLHPFSTQFVLWRAYKEHFEGTSIIREPLPINLDEGEGGNLFIKAVINGYSVKDSDKEEDEESFLDTVKPEQKDDFMKLLEDMEKQELTPSDVLGSSQELPGLEESYDIDEITFEDIAEGRVDPDELPEDKQEQLAERLAEEFFDEVIKPMLDSILEESDDEAEDVEYVEPLTPPMLEDMVEEVEEEPQPSSLLDDFRVEETDSQESFGEFIEVLIGEQEKEAEEDEEELFILPVDVPAFEGKAVAWKQASGDYTSAPISFFTHGGGWTPYLTENEVKEAVEHFKDPMAKIVEGIEGTVEIADAYPKA